MPEKPKQQMIPKRTVIGLLMVVASFFMLLGLFAGSLLGAQAVITTFDTMFDGSSVTFTLNETFLAEEALRTGVEMGVFNASGDLRTS